MAEDLALRAMLQQLLSVASEEDTLLLYELARRFILSGTTIDANGAVNLGTVSADSFSGTLDTLTANNAQIETANVNLLTANVVQGSLVSGTTVEASDLNATIANLSLITAETVQANTVSANTVTANNIVLPIV